LAHVIYNTTRDGKRDAKAVNQDSVARMDIKYLPHSIHHIFETCFWICFKKVNDSLNKLRRISVGRKNNFGMDDKRTEVSVPDLPCSEVNSESSLAEIHI